MKKSVFSFLFKTFRRQLIVGWVAVNTLMIALFLTHLGLNQQAFLNDQQKTQAVAIAQTLALASSTALSSRDFNALQELIEGQALYPDLRYSMIVDKQGEILAHSERTRRGQYLKGLPSEPRLSFFAQEATRVDVATPIFLANRPIGWVRIAVGQTFLKEKLGQIQSNAFIYAGTSIVVSFILSFFIAQFLTKRLEAVKKVADGVEEGQTHLRVNITGEDEAAQLADQFNQMLDTLSKRETERQKLEQELQKHRDHLLELVETQTIHINAIVETAADGIISIDAQGIILTFNRAAENIFGYLSSEMIGQSVSSLMAEPYASLYQQYLKRCLESNDFQNEQQRQELKGKRKTCEIFPLSLSMSKMMIRGLVRFTGIIRDISAQKATETALIRAREQAEQSSQAKSNFLANMSHEIRTPMNAIIGMTDLVLDTPLQAEQEKLLRSVSQSSRSLLSLLNDILDLSKLESGKMSLEKIPFCLKQLLESIEEMTQVGAAMKGLHFSYQLDASIPACVEGDPTRLRQVLLNLVGNAIKFTSEGSICVSISKGKKEHDWIFSVEDTGIGIPQKQLKTIFERFAQVDDSTTRRFGGTGLGTTISRELVEHMGGHIWVESEEGKGTCFQFELPLPIVEGLNNCPLTFATQPLGQAPYTRPLSILLVEDIPLNQELVIRRLTQRNHRIEVADNGQIALKCYQNKDFDLVLMDVMMPEMDGETATREIRRLEMETGKHIPIIMLTASVMQIDQQKYFEAGADDFVGKPIDFFELYTKIARFFETLPAPIQPKETQQDHSEVSLPFLEQNQVIDLHLALSQWQRLPVYQKALTGFIEHYQDSIQQFSSLIESEQWKEAYHLAHTLKGLVSHLGGVALARELAHFEHLLKSVSAPFTAYSPEEAAFEQVKQAFTDFISATAPILAYFEPPPLEENNTIPTEALLNALTNLIAALKCSELDEIALETILKSGRPEFKPLEHYLDAFDFKAAAELAEHLYHDLQQSV